MAGLVARKVYPPIGNWVIYINMLGQFNYNKVLSTLHAKVHKGGFTSEITRGILNC